VHVITDTSGAEQLRRAPNHTADGEGQVHADPDARHRVAVAQSLIWAQESATRGDYLTALGWIQVIEAIGDQLPHDFEVKRVAWVAALAESRDKR
jgi:hypothetical protein